jgi:lysophospholipase L1-like esterase
VTRPTDDSLMNRFDEQGLRRFRARDAVIALAIVAILLVLFEGDSIRRAGEQMNPGVGQHLILAVGKPAGWLADQLPLRRLAHRATAWLSPDTALSTGPGFAATAGAAVTREAFDPAQLGGPQAPRRRLRTLLVTGDSMSTPLDIELARRLVSHHVNVIRDPHLGTGISKPFLVDWGRLARTQAQRDQPDAVVVFIGANEGFPMPGPGGRDVACCGADWAAIYANRVRDMMDTYRRRGAARVYWVQLPAPRSAARQRISRVVNAAIAVAAEPWRSQVRLIDTAATFTPHGYRDAMSVNGTQTIVRQADGIHLNDTGSGLLAGMVLGAIRRDFTYP